MIQRLFQFQDFFKEVKDFECFLMSEDFCNMIQGNKVKMNFKTIIFKDIDKEEEKGRQASKYVDATYKMHK